MTYGLQITNNDNKILVDSDFAHYHFAGIATLTGSSFTVPVIVEGNNTQHSTTAGQTISSGQTLGKVQRHTLPARADSNSPPPMCFLKPHNNGQYSIDGGTERGHSESSAVILTQRVGTSWEMWTLTAPGGGANDIPRLYCFLPLDEMTATAAAPATGDNYGLATFDSSGNKTYDSRKLPLKITATIDASTPPSRARSSIGTATSFNPVFTPNQHNYHAFTIPSDWTQGAVNTNNALSDLMYYCPSVAHSVQDLTAFTDGEGFQAQGYSSFFYAWARGDLWWVFSRNTFSIVNENTSSNQRYVLKSMYTGYGAGHVWKSEENSSSFLAVVAAIALSFATFGASLATLAVAVTATALASTFSGSSAGEGLYYPYEDGNRNVSEAGPMLLSRPSFYD